MLENGAVISTEGREYTVISIIGKGANTAAYLAECRHEGLVSRCILKECLSEETERFIAAARLQNELRQRSALTNQTPPVSHIFEANGTAFCDVVCFGGTTLDRLTDLTLLQYAELCQTITRTVSCYHKSGYLCLDLKHTRIFIF